MSHIDHMNDFILTYETVLRLSVFLLGLALFMSLETLFPRKLRTLPRMKRWASNLLFVGINTLVLRLLFPIAAVGAALWTQDAGWGLLNILNWPFFLEVILSIFVLDFFIYIQHIATHKIPVLWAFHKVHHIDCDVDVTTGLRFHPVEILFSMAYKIVCTVILGPAALAVILFEIILNSSAMFNHSNLYLPARIDQFLRIFIVTPDMHRVHHSVRPQETNSNYGFSLSLWDRMFQTYCAEPTDGHHVMKIGLKQHQTDKHMDLIWSLALPFKSY